MRLFLLPISTRRTLIYCERVREAVSGQPASAQPYSERIINRASETWAAWEKADKGWKKQLTVYGNQVFKRIPYEEWGLKSIPPATKKRLQEVDGGKLTFECLYPASFLKSGKVVRVLETLAKERQSLHRNRLWASIAWMPVTVPFTLIPVIPNIPFFYLCFRAYSHYRALWGGRLLEHLMEKKLVKLTPSPVMDEMYTAGLLHLTRQESHQLPKPTDAEVQKVVHDVEAQAEDGKGEVLIIRRWSGKLLAEAFKLPEMEIEIERAVEQVEKLIKTNQETDRKQEPEAAGGQQSRVVKEKQQ